MSGTASLSIVLDATLSKFEADMKRAASVVSKTLTDFSGNTRALDATAASINKVGKAADDTASKFGALGEAFKKAMAGGSISDVLNTAGLARAGILVAGAAAAFNVLSTAVMGVVTAGDQAATSLARLSNAAGGRPAGADIFARMYELARQTGVSIDDASGAFSRFAIASRQIGATNTQVAQLVDTISKFGIVSGGSAGESAAAIQQLGQALASGRLQGDELRSILENMPLLAEGLARELGVSIGRLREMGTEGKLTADVVFPAILRLSSEVNAQFAAMPPTFARAVSILSVAWDGLLAKIDQALQLSRLLAGAITAAGNAIEAVRRGLGGAISSEAQVTEALARQARAARELNAADAAIRRAEQEQNPIERRLRETNTLGGAPMQDSTAALRTRRDAAQREVDAANTEAERIQAAHNMRLRVEQDDADRRAGEANRDRSAVEIRALQDRLDATRAINRKFAEDREALRLAEERGAITAAQRAQTERDLQAQHTRDLAAAARREAGPQRRARADPQVARDRTAALALDSELNRLFESTRTPMEQFEQRVSRVGVLVRDQLLTQDYGGLETGRRAILEYAESAAKALRDMGTEGTAGLRQLQERLTAMGPDLLANGSVQSIEQWSEQVQAALARAASSGRRGQQPTDFWSAFTQGAGGKDQTQSPDVASGLALGRGAVQGLEAFGGALASIAEGASSAGDAFAKFGQTVLRTLAQLAAQAAIMALIRGVFGAASGTVGGAPKLPGLASGGPVSAGRAYVVGEEGPEVFMPGVAGRILPNSSSGGGAGQMMVNVQNNAPGVVVTPQQVDQRTVMIAVNLARQQVAADYAESMRTGYGSYSEPTQKSLNVRRRF